LDTSWTSAISRSRRPCPRPWSEIVAAGTVLRVPAVVTFRPYR
jgi:hypothetical protein